MQWGSVSEFFAMGGKALYVWGSYIVTAVALGVELVLVKRRARTSLTATSPKSTGGSER